MQDFSLHNLHVRKFDIVPQSGMEIFEIVVKFVSKNTNVSHITYGVQNATGNVTSICTIFFIHIANN